MALFVRREMLGLSALAVMGGPSVASEVLGPAQVEPIDFSGTWVGESDVARVRDLYKQVHQTGGLAGGATFNPTVLTRQFAESLGMLRARYRSVRTRQTAHAAVANLGETIGFNLFDQGLHDTARQVMLTALRVGRDAGPDTPGTQASTLVGMSNQALFLGRPKDAVGLLALMAGEEHELSGRALAMLYSMRARAAAEMGDLRGVRGFIAASEEHYREGQPELWNINGWYDRAELKGDAGAALTRLAAEHDELRDDALVWLSDSIATYRKREQRSRARALVAKARLHALRRDVDDTVATTSDAVSAARALQSPRVDRELRDLLPALRPLRRRSGDITALIHDIDGPRTTGI